MRRILLIILIFFSVNSFAQNFELPPFTCGNEPWGDLDTFNDWTACFDKQKKAELHALRQLVVNSGGTWVGGKDKNRWRIKSSSDICNDACIGFLITISDGLQKLHAGRAFLIETVAIDLGIVEVESAKP